MMKRLMCAALLAASGATQAQTPAASAPVSAAKKELVQKVMALQLGDYDGLSRNLVGQSVGRMVPAIQQALQQQVPPEKRESVGKAIDADIKKYVDESTPVVRAAAIKAAPSTIGAALEEKFSEDELKQLAAWLDSPVNKKFQQIGPEMQNNFMQRIVADVRPALEPKTQSLEQKIRSELGAPPISGDAAPTTAPAPASKSTAPARKASGAK